MNPNCPGGQASSRPPLVRVTGTLVAGHQRLQTFYSLQLTQQLGSPGHHNTGHTGAHNQGSQRFHNHREGPTTSFYPLLVLSHLRHNIKQIARPL